MYKFIIVFGLIVLCLFMYAKINAPHSIRTPEGSFASTIEGETKL